VGIETRGAAVEKPSPGVTSLWLRSRAWIQPLLRYLGADFIAEEEKDCNLLLFMEMRDSSL